METDKSLVDCRTSVMTEDRPSDFGGAPHFSMEQEKTLRVKERALQGFSKLVRD